MIIKGMVIEGDWVEAHLYFDFLWLLDAAGAITAFDLEAFIGARLNGEGSAARKLFARNDLLPRMDGSVRASACPPDVQALLAGREPITVSRSDVDEFSYRFARQQGLADALDVRFYYGRAFVSAPASLVQFDAPGRQSLPAGSRRSSASNLPLNGRRVFDDGTPVQVQCRLGAVSLSCGGEGGFVALGALDDDPSWRARPQRLAPVSFATEVMNAGIGNIDEDDEVDVFATLTRPVPGSRSSRSGDQSDDRQAIVSFEKQPDPSVARRLAAFRPRPPQSSGGVAEAEMQVEVEQSFLTTTKAFYVMSDETMRMLPLTSGTRLLTGDPRPAVYPSPSGRVVGSTTTAGRVVVETDDDIQILSGNRWHRLFDEPVYRVRGHPASRWYRQLVAIVARGRTELLFICDE